jgi:rhamnose transport system ATP-binding protein
MPQPLLTADGLHKAFGATKALTDVSLRLAQGERLAVVGENGAGKSTLMKILAGVYSPDGGEMTFLGEPYRPQSPAQSLAAGLSIVYQEPTFFPQLTVLENIFVGREIKDRWGNLRWNAMREEARELFGRLELPMGFLGRRMDALSLGNQQTVLIARAIHQNARVLILDEPTSILTDAEANKLFGLVEEVVGAGGGVLYITHRFEEFEHVADRLIVLKDGRLVGEMPVSEAREQRLIELMSGRALEQAKQRSRSSASDSASLLEVRNLSRHGMYEDVSFDVSRGEIVGFYGLVGAGRTETVLSIFGDLKPDGGTMMLDGRPFDPSSPSEAIKAGVVYVPEDRKTQGIFPLMDTGSNLSAAALGSLASLSVIRKGQESSLVRRFFESLGIKARSPSDSILSLSGGSQQKVVLARWLATEPKMLLLDEPTRGIDVGTKAEIHRLIRELADDGLGIILISSELPELLALSDKVYVLHEGRMTAAFGREEATEEEVLRATMGFVGDHGK